jgi:hypothetical protein
MIIRVNFGFHGNILGAPAPVFRCAGCGFGPLYNAAKPLKQASYLAETLGFASGGGRAYLGGWQSDWSISHERSGTA